MFIESLVKATVELQGFRVDSVTGGTSGLEAVIVPDLRFNPRCGQCQEPAPYRDTRAMRRFRHVPMWGIPVELRYEPRRVSCTRCEGVHVEAMLWVSGKQRMTRALMVTLATWSRALPWKQVARLFRCVWGTVATAVEEAVAYGLANRDLEGLTHIGIDEISRKRGHVYVTNVYDLARKRLVWSGEGRRERTLEAFFEFLGPEKTALLEGICCDMWQPYIDVIKARAPQAVLVFDKFHIVRHLMEAVDQVRRDEIREKEIAGEGTVMLVEPFANDRVEDNVNPIGRLYYAASTTLCCAHAISEQGTHVLGAQAGERRLAEIFESAGFSRFRRATQTPFNLILEARR